MCVSANVWSNDRGVDDSSAQGQYRASIAVAPGLDDHPRDTLKKWYLRELNWTAVLLASGTITRYTQPKTHIHSP